MKTNKLFLALSFLSMVILISCSKDETSKVDQNQSQLSAFDLKVGNLVNNFKTKLDSKLKSDETMSVDSALWYINATINYTYGGATVEGQKPAEAETGSAVINLPENNGTLTFEQVETLYDETLETVKDLYYSVEADDKKFSSATIVPDEDNPLQLTITTTTYSSWGLPAMFTWPENGSYHWNLEHSPSAIPEFENMYASVVQWGNILPPGSTAVWVFNQEILVDATTFRWKTGSFANNEYYYLFYNNNSYPNYHLWLCGDEMNFHFARIVDIANVKVPAEYNFTVGPNFKCYEIDVMPVRTVNSYLEISQHNMKLRYGNRVITTKPPIDL
jgi:hypothetical protein